MSKTPVDPDAARVGRPTESGTVTLFLGRERYVVLERLRAKENTTLHALVIKAIAHYCKTEHDTVF
jgi:hypothetical protein